MIANLAIRPLPSGIHAVVDLGCTAAFALLKPTSYRLQRDSRFGWCLEGAIPPSFRQEERRDRVIEGYLQMPAIHIS